MDRWNGKVAVVTGSSGGIGAGIARGLVKAGMKVVGLARRVELVEAIAEELKGEKGKLYAVKCDISKEEEIKAAFVWIKVNLEGVDVLINNAGIAPTGKLVDEGNSDTLRSVLDTNVLGLCICTREAVASMRERKVAGHIVHINSVFGHRVVDQLKAGFFLNIYPASKYAVTALTETLRQELIHLDTKIKVTSISPGAVTTEITNFPEGYPVLQPADISNAVLYVLGTPEHVQVHELTIRPVGEKIL